MPFASSIRRAAAVAAAAGAAAVAVPVAVAAKTSHAKLWSTASYSVICGIKVHAKSKPAHWVICRATATPLTGGVGYVQIAAKGKSQRVTRFGYAWTVRPGKEATLFAGSKWSRLGVACTVVGGGAEVTCTNGSGHGFTTSHGKYTLF